MKQFYLLLLAVICFGNYSAMADTVDWYFATSENSWATTEATQFQTTETANVYVLKSYTNAGSFNFQITNAAWSSTYGWYETISSADVEYTVGANNGNGWAELEAATYDVYFNETNATIKFVKSETQEEVDEGSNWYITGAFNSWALADDTKFSATDDANVFVIDNFTIPESSITDGAWTFVITTAEWGAVYYYGETIATAGTYNFIKRSESETAYCSISSGTYDLTWDKSNHTLTITEDGNSTTDSYVLEIGSAGAATLVLPFESTIPAGVKAYTLTYTSGSSSADAEEVTGTLAANTPVLINASANGSYTFYAASTSLEKSDVPVYGALTGVWEETYAPAGAYVLQNNNGTVAFYQVETDKTVKISANRAYLTATGNNAKTININFGDATGINTINCNAVDNNNKVFNLQGVQVDNTNISKGIYIRGGKKIVIK